MVRRPLDRKKKPISLLLTRVSLREVAPFIAQALNIPNKATKKTRNSYKQSLSSGTEMSAPGAEKSLWQDLARKTGDLCSKDPNLSVAFRPEL